MNAVVSLAGSDTHVPIKVLNEKGAKQSFILDTVLTFFSKSQIGDILMKRMEYGLVKA